MTRPRSPGRVALIACGVVVLALACGGPSTEPDPEAIGAVVAALEGQSPETIGRLLATGLAEVETGVVPPACAEAFDAVARAPYETRSTVLSKALAESCPRPCDLTDADFVELSGLVARERTKRAVELCRDTGADPFGGNLAEKRAQIPALDYLAGRLVIDRALEALAEDPAAQADLRELLPAAATGLAFVEVDPAAWPEEPLSADPGPGLNVTEVERKLRILIPAIRGCAEPEGERRASDHPPGRAVISLVTDAEGRVRKSHVALSSLTLGEEECLAELMTGQDLPPPVDGPAIVDLSIDLTR